MSDAGERIARFEEQVIWRKRKLALQDAAALLMIVAGFLSAAIVGYTRLKPAEFRWGIVVAVIFTGVAGLALTRWFLTRATAREAAFATDEKLALEDRLTTAQTIIERGETPKPVEAALIEDAASKLADAKIASVVPYRFPRWYVLSFAAIIAFSVSLVLPQKETPGAQELAAERAEIQSAGEQLEKTAQEVEHIAPAGSETTKLAREQADLGRAFRRAADTRAEALRKLSLLGDRIRQRHDELADTRADEIVTLAEDRLRSPVTGEPKSKRNEKVQATSGNEPAAEVVPQTSEKKKTNASEEQKRTDAGIEAKAGEARKNRAAEKAGKNEAKQQKPEEKVASNNKAADQQTALKEDRSESRSANAKKEEAKITEEHKSQEQAASANEPSKPQSQQPETKSKPETASGDQQASAQNEKAGETQKEEAKRDEGKSDSNGLTGALAQQAAKALPGLSEQLLKKAQQLRANELKPEDIKQIQQAAQLLSRDLSKIAQSRELQQAVEQLAKQVDPAQLEQVAREFAKQEQLRRELEAAARLMMENQQVKQAVAGLAQQLAETGEQFRQQRRQSIERNGNEEKLAGALEAARSGRNPADSRRSSSGGRYERATPHDLLNAQGREEKLAGKLQRGAGGEQLFLQARPGAGAARAPYSSAYPQYRREAERSVERSQAPPRMRSIVRNYFDAINPDVEKKP